MDPLSQGVIAAVAAQQRSSKKNLVIATVLGFFSGMAADIDIFFKSDIDPLFYLEFHRQFTHSLLFIPIGSFLCACFFYYLFLRSKDIKFKETYIYCTLGYATHGLLDSCTSYGTQLLWPFTNERIAWNLISIIDPLFTIPLVILVLFAVVKNNKIFSYIALSWAFLYITFAMIQQDRAEAIGMEIAKSRGHLISSIIAKPSFANLIVWKTIYTTENSYYIDAVRLGYNSNIIEGTEVKKFEVKESFPWLNIHSQQAKDIERFRWFSNGYIAISDVNPNYIMDIRYSTLPYKADGLWGIKLNRDAKKYDHVETISNRRSRIETYKKLWELINN